MSTILPSQSYLALGTRPLLSLLGLPASDLFPFSISFSDNLYWASQTGLSGYPYYQHLLANSTSTLPPDTSAFLFASTQLAQSLATTHSLLLAISSPFLQSLRPHFTTAWLQSTKLQTLIPGLPDLLGFSGSRTFALLVQDPSVPRPLGGRISQFGLITLHQGRLTDITLQPASFVDTQLAGVAQASASFTHGTALPTWQFADSLWEPDFAQAKTDVLWFLAKALNLHPDGLIATTTDFTSSLSALTVSPSKLPSLTVTQNLQLLAHIFTALDQRQLLIQSTTDTQIMSKLGWDGGVTPSVCRAISCLSDAIAISDSTLSSTPHPESISRTTNLTVNLNSAQVSSTLELVYPASNASYLVRISLPLSSHISQVLLNGQPMTPQSTSSVFALSIQLSPSHPTTLSLQFDRQLTVANLRYQLTLLNQPGQTGPVNLKITYPATWSAQANLKPQIAHSGLLEYNTILNSPQSLSFDFTQ